MALTASSLSPDLNLSLLLARGRPQVAEVAVLPTVSAWRYQIQTLF